MYSKEVIVTNKTGLHARPASEFVKEASKFKSAVSIEFKDKKINGKSIINVLAIGISAGSKIIISAEGEDEKQAVDDLVNLVQTKFNE